MATADFDPSDRGWLILASATAKQSRASTAADVVLDELLGDRWQKYAESRLLFKLHRVRVAARDASGHSSSLGSLQLAVEELHKELELPSTKSLTYLLRTLDPGSPHRVPLLAACAHVADSIQIQLLEQTLDLSRRAPELEIQLYDVFPFYRAE